MTLPLDDLARWQAIRKDGRVTVEHQGDQIGPCLYCLYCVRCARCGHETRGLAGAPMIAHWKREHAEEWREAK